jgi:TonB family protein
MSNWLRRSITVFAIAWVAMGNATPMLAADAAVAPDMTAPVVLKVKTARGLLASPTLPEYPTVARLNYIEGKVCLHVQVSQAGKVTAAHVVKGNALLAASALKAVRHWLYHPFQTATGPAGFQADVVVKFALQYHKKGFIPPNAERDFSRQIRIPQVLRKPDAPQPSSTVRLRVLVNEEGSPVDYELISGQTSAFGEARQLVDGWKFLPARWGTIAVPWYLELDVPGGDSFLSSTGPGTIAQ